MPLVNVARFPTSVLNRFSHHQDTLSPIKDNSAYTTEHKKELIAALTRGQYDAVVANPPYITVKDKALNAGYRERYNHLRGKYQLTAPFMELLFKLAKHGHGAQAAGWVGQITSNASGCRRRARGCGSRGRPPATASRWLGGRRR